MTSFNCALSREQTKLEMLYLNGSKLSFKNVPPTSDNITAQAWAGNLACAFCALPPCLKPIALEHQQHWFCLLKSKWWRHGQHWLWPSPSLPHILSIFWNQISLINHHEHCHGFTHVEGHGRTQSIGIGPNVMRLDDNSIFRGYGQPREEMYHSKGRDFGVIISENSPYSRTIVFFGQSGFLPK